MEKSVLTWQVWLNEGKVNECLIIRERCEIQNFGKSAFLFETKHFRCKNLQKPIKTLCFGHFQFGTRRAQLSLSAISWQSTICSAACTRCPLCPFQIGLGVPVFDSFALSGAYTHPPPPPTPFFPEGRVLWHIICCSFHSVQCWSAQCCHKHKSDPPLCQTASEQVVSWCQSTEVDRKSERDVSIGVSVHMRIWCSVQPADLLSGVKSVWEKNQFLAWRRNNWTVFTVSTCQ